MHLSLRIRIKQFLMKEVVAVITILLLLIISESFYELNQSEICLEPGTEALTSSNPARRSARRKSPTNGEELRKYAPELFDVLPSSFLSDFKNPCFYRKDSGELNCLPYFYIVGMAKCGTTDVWDKLVSHPDVIDVPKEPHWWGLRRFRTDTVKLYQDKVEDVLKMPGSVSTKSVNYYLNWFKKFAVPSVASSSRNGYHPKVFGDASISTATGVSEGWRTLDPEAEEPAYVTADLIHAVQPKAKIIIMIRNTTEWAHSWYRYSFTSPTSESFDRSMHKFISCVERCLTSHTERYCAYSDSCGKPIHHPLRDIHIGLYHWYIRDWFRTFGRDDVMIIPLEDWHSNQPAVYRKILQYLELRQLPLEEETAILRRDAKNVIRHKFPMFPETRRALEDFFRPHNRRLAELLQDERYNSYV